MSYETLNTDLFTRSWSAGVAAVLDEAVDSLWYLAAIPRPTVASYQATTGRLKRDMDALLEIGLSKLQRAGELPE